MEIVLDQDAFSRCRKCRVSRETIIESPPDANLLIDAADRLHFRNAARQHEFQPLGLHPVQ